jgi:hypothetical protein
LLEKSSIGFKIAYVGAIDNNSLDPSSAERYVEYAIVALLKGERPSPATTKPIGCIIKTKSL